MEQTKQKKAIKSVSGYEYLERMVNIKSTSSFQPTSFGKTTRTIFITSELGRAKVDFIEDIYEIPEAENNEKYVNIYAHFPSQNKDAKTIVVLAHHDINNPKSQNCQDNTASVCNLLELCSLLKGVDLNNHVTVCFIDAEEIVNISKCGATQLTKRIKENHPYFTNFEFAINLELTGVGNHIWMDSKKVEKSTLADYLKSSHNMLEVATPYNDASVLRHFELDSICIGTLTDNDVESYFDNKFPPTWALCHSENDTIDKISKKDMSAFVKLLYKFVTKYNPNS